MTAVQGVLERFVAMKETCARLIDRERAVPVHRGNLLRVVNEAWERASEGAKDGVDKKKQNSERSKKWVDELARGFRQEYPAQDANTSRKTHHRVFWAGNEKNQKHFHRNEFLFDVMVCSVSDMESLESRPNRLEFIDRCHWQVESEFNLKDSREVIVDMSKLVVGSAENKLFVAAHRKNNRKELLGMCGAMASRCDGHVYLAFVSHPNDWVKRPERPRVYEWLAGDWVAVRDTG